MEAVADRAPLQSALRKAHWRIIPLLGLCYLVAYMDRTNISFASGPMNRDLHFTPHVYGLGAGLFFLSYALCEIPSNRLLLHFGARRWLARIMLTWGLLAAGMLFIRTPTSFYGMRLLLGIAEAGYFPGAIYVLSQWFPCDQRARAISWFYISFPLSTVVMGSVAGTLLKLNGRLGLHGWQWLFLIEALPAILLSACIWFTLPDSPSAAHWLTPSEREAIDDRIPGSHTRAHASAPKHDLRQVLREPRVWILGLTYFCILGVSYAVTFFLPAILGDLTHWPLETVGYLIAGTGLVAAFSMVLNATHSDRYRERRWHTVVPVLLMGLCLLTAGLHLHGPVAVFALLLNVVLYTAIQGPLLAVASSICAGENAALAIATFNTCGIFGGFVGPYWMGWMRELTSGYSFGIASLSLACLLGAVCVLCLMRSSPTTQPSPTIV
jgi:MFS transporter, ACS family, tartrate transporter